MCETRVTCGKTAPGCDDRAKDGSCTSGAVISNPAMCLFAVPGVPVETD